MADGNDGKQLNSGWQKFPCLQVCPHSYLVSSLPADVKRSLFNLKAHRVTSPFSRCESQEAALYSFLKSAINAVNPVNITHTHKTDLACFQDFGDLPLEWRFSSWRIYIADTRHVLFYSTLVSTAHHKPFHQ